MKIGVRRLEYEDRKNNLETILSYFNQVKQHG